MVNSTAIIQPFFSGVLFFLVSSSVTSASVKTRHLEINSYNTAICSLAFDTSWAWSNAPTFLLISIEISVLDSSCFEKLISAKIPRLKNSSASKVNEFNISFFEVNLYLEFKRGISSTIDFNF